MDFSQLSSLYFGNNRPLKPKQIEALNAISSFPQTNRDLVVSLPVGYGKSLLYHLTPYILGGIVIVVSPLNIIQKDQLFVLKDHNIPACRIDVNGKVFTAEGKGTFSSVLKGEHHVILMHPEGLCKAMTKGFQNEEFSEKVVAVFTDECHIVDEWSKEFRRAYNILKTLPATFHKAMFVGLSGSLTTERINNVHISLGMANPLIIRENPDRPHVFLSRALKQTVGECGDKEAVYEQIYKFFKLYENPDSYPVTLIFMPLKYMSDAMGCLCQLFGRETVHTSKYSCLYSTQDTETVDVTLSELKKENPRIRLILTTSSAGMGFDPDNVTRVIHCNPPRCMTKYLQEIGRAGRRGQASQALLYLDNSDIRSNLPGMCKDIINYCKTVNCMRSCMLETCGFSKNEDSPSGCLCCEMCKARCKCPNCHS